MRQAGAPFSSVMEGRLQLEDSAIALSVRVGTPLSTSRVTNLSPSTNCVSSISGLSFKSSWRPARCSLSSLMLLADPRREQFIIGTFLAPHARTGYQAPSWCACPLISPEASFQRHRFASIPYEES